VIKIAGLGLAGLLVLAVLILAFGVPAQPLVSYLADRAENAGFELRVRGSSTMSLTPSLTLTADDAHLTETRSGGEEILAAKRINIALSLFDLFRGDIRINDVRISQPIIRLTSGRSGSPRPSTANRDSTRRPLSVERLVIEDGTVILRDAKENLSGHLEAFKLTASAPAQGPLDVQAEGKAGQQAVRVAFRANSASQIADGRPTPIDARLEMPGLLKTPLALTASLKAVDRIISIDGIRGTLGSGRVNGSVLVDTAGMRPNVNASLVLDRLELATSDRRDGNDAGSAAAWSDQPLELAALRVFNATVKISARELALGAIRLAPAEIESRLQSGLLSVAVENSELYGGPVQGKLVIDADARNPRHGATFDFTGVNALTLLTDVAGFDHIEGKLAAKFDLTASGASPAAIVSSLGGSAQVNVEDGAVRDVNIPGMIRALSSQTLQGWQEKGSDKTEFASLAATFRVADGQAVTDDLRLAGPLVRMTGKGTVNLASRTMDFRVDPRLVLTLQGQGGPTDPAGLGVPVVIRGAWAEPQIYPDVAGILDNPEAAFAKLKTMGGSLLGLINPSPPSPSQDGPQKKSKAEEVIKSLDQLIRGDGRNNAPSDTRNQVRDVIRDLLGR